LSREPSPLNPSTLLLEVAGADVLDMAVKLVLLRQRDAERAEGAALPRVHLVAVT
jgi:hypothetical protein